jgi:catechol 2,3-dioxygenase-like lactoylglutathione lyase family enzyme
VTSVVAAIFAVRDLQRSVDFYRDVLGLSEVLRDDGVVGIANQVGGPLLFLRQGAPHGVHSGQDAIGVRSLMFEVPTVAELDRIADRLRAQNGLRERHHSDPTYQVEVVTGYDPDRNALAFLASTDGSPVRLTDLKQVPPTVYGIDL